MTDAERIENGYAHHHTFTDKTWKHYVAMYCAVPLGLIAAFGILMPFDWPIRLAGVIGLYVAYQTFRHWKGDCTYDHGTFPMSDELLEKKLASEAHNRECARKYAIRLDAASNEWTLPDGMILEPWQPSWDYEPVPGRNDAARYTTKLLYRGDETRIESDLYAFLVPSMYREDLEERFKEVTADAKLQVKSAVDRMRLKHGDLRS